MGRRRRGRRGATSRAGRRRGSLLGRWNGRGKIRAGRRSGIGRCSRRRGCLRLRLWKWRGDRLGSQNRLRSGYRSRRSRGRHRRGRDPGLLLHLRSGPSQAPHLVLYLPQPSLEGRCTRQGPDREPEPDQPQGRDDENGKDEELQPDRL